MRKIGVTLVLGAALSASVFATHAADAAPGAVEKPSVAPVRPLQPMAVLRVEASVRNASSKCGEPFTADVILANRTLKPWNGTVSLVSGGTANTPVTLGASGAEATKIVKITGAAPIDCKKPLGIAGVRVYQSPQAPILVQTLKPALVTGRKDFLTGGATPTTLVLRSVMFNGKCGEKVSPQAVMYAPPGLPPSAPVTAQVKLTFGGATTTATVKTPGSNLAVPLDVPGTLDCNAAAGIPSLDYGVSGSQSASGSVAPGEVTWE